MAGDGKHGLCTTGLVFFTPAVHYIVAVGVQEGER